MRRVMSFLAGAMTGAMVGAALAVLLAPYSGEDLRTELQERVETLRQEMQTAAAGRRAELEAQLESLRAPQKPTGPEPQA